jgi:hypothetical protein
MALTRPFGRPQRPTDPGSAALADNLLRSYVAWREASSGVRAAYERWAGWDYADREVGYGGYLAALQQEAHAARVSERQIDLVRVGLDGRR